MRVPRWLVVCAIAAVACSEPQAPEQGARSTLIPDLNGGPQLEAERAALLAADQAASATAVTQGVTTGILASLADDAYFLFPGEAIVRGKTAAEAILAANFDAGSRMPWTPLFAEVSIDSRSGYTFGTLEITQDGAHIAYGKYITWWRKGPLGNWEIEALNPVFYFRNVTRSPDFPHPDRSHPIPPVPQPAVEQTLLRTDGQFAQASIDIGEAQAFLAYADEKATTLGNPDFLVGRDAIYQAHLGRAPGDRLFWTPKFAGASQVGDLGFTIGNAVFTSGTTGLSSYIKYLTIWHRLPDGSYKFVQDGGSTEPPPAP